MTSLISRFALVTALVAQSGAALAQTDASAVSPSASAPAPFTTRPGPRLMTPEQKRDTAATGSDLTPERQVTSQVNVPFGKAPPPSAADARSTRRGLPTSATGGINDAVASCEAQVSTAARTACLQRQGKK